jgi:hypothetical protein
MDDESLDEVILSAAGLATSVLVLALPIYYVWKLVAPFRRVGVPHWPPVLALSLWLLQWPFAIMSAVRCMGGGAAIRCAAGSSLSAFSRTT